MLLLTANVSVEQMIVLESQRVRNKIIMFSFRRVNGTVVMFMSSLNVLSREGAAEGGGARQALARLRTPEVFWPPHREFVTKLEAEKARWSCAWRRRGRSRTRPWRVSAAWPLGRAFRPLGEAGCERAPGRASRGKPRC